VDNVSAEPWLRPNDSHRACGRYAPRRIKRWPWLNPSLWLFVAFGGTGIRMFIRSPLRTFRPASPGKSSLVSSQIAHGYRLRPHQNVSSSLANRMHSPRRCISSITEYYLLRAARNDGHFSPLYCPSTLPTEILLWLGPPVMRRHCTAIVQDHYY